MWLHLIMAPIALLARNFSRRFLFVPFCRLCLKALGIRIAEKNRPAQFPQEAVYIANHTSTLDIFVYNALAIPRCRFFMTGYEWTVAAVYLPAAALGTFLTASQNDTEKRRKIFANAAKTLAHSKDNVFLTPEGQRYLDKKIGRFNKGAFHLAISLSRPIIPFFVHVSDEIDPGMGYSTNAGTVRVYWGEAVENLPAVFDGGREIPDRFQVWYEEFNQFLLRRTPMTDKSNPFYKVSQQIDFPQAAR